MTKNVSLNQDYFKIDFKINSAEIIPKAAYVHIPFCRRRCYYCDFPISVVGDQGTAASVMVEEYIAALIRDIQLTEAPEQILETIFFGGGTPSLLSPSEICKVIQVIEAKFGIAADAEISMEIDPGTFNRDRLQGYLAAGLNRFSLGVQTFDEELLKLCGRSHGYGDVMQAIEIIKSLNVVNFSLDLISGLPHQTLDHCQASLDRAIEISPNHLSCYDLVLEPVTAFGKQYQPGKRPLPDDNDTADMYRLTQKTLTQAGYHHYEVSNYAKAGYQCRHNRFYWENQPYYGFGMGAASYVAGTRYTRPKTRREYYAWLNSGVPIDVPEISSMDYFLETLMLGLRLAEGISLQQFQQGIIDQMWSCLQPFYRQGWIEIIDDTGRLLDLTHQNQLSQSSCQLRLRDPEGFLFSNIVLASIFERFE